MRRPSDTGPKCSTKAAPAADAAQAEAARVDTEHANALHLDAEHVNGMAVDAAHADAACAACGVVLESRIHSGEIVDVFRGRSSVPAGPGCNPASSRDSVGRSPSLTSPAPSAAAMRVPVAVKLTTARWRGHRGAVELVAREHRVLAAVDHPHVVRPFCFAEREGAAVLVTEYLRGGDLVPLAGDPPSRWVPAARAVAAALDALHAAGFVHGDVKARNVLFDADGRAKLIDFGSAQPIGRPYARNGRTSAQGGRISPQGAPGPGPLCARAGAGRTRAHEPLRFELRHASPTEDVYAFAVLLYELLTGRLPFGQEPGDWTAPAPIETGSSRGLRALAARVTATLHAAEPREVGTLIEFADVLESVHGEAARAV